MTNRYEAKGQEAEYEPGSRGRVLRNLQGITSVREMNRVESEALLKATDRFFKQYTEDHEFTAQNIRDMHREWLGDIYAWAGEYRNVNMAKGDFHFAAAAQIPKLMRELELGPLTEYTPCSFNNHDEIARAIAVVHAELVLIHPFREGNGRCSRVLASLMALQSGLPPLNFGGITGRKKQEYFSAVQIATGREYEPMIKIFKSVIKRTLRAYG